jgi:nitrite reductase (NADH) large subunit
MLRDVADASGTTSASANHGKRYPVAARTRLVVIGNGMVGHAFIDVLIQSGQRDRFDITVLGEEPRPAYDRVHLSEFFTGRSAEDLSMLPSPGYYGQHGITLRTRTKATAIDRANRTVQCADGTQITYDRLVLATGSFPFVPPVPGKDAAGCFVYRTIEDLEAIRAHASAVKRGVVVGGGLLGLEAANALKSLGLETSVVEFAPRLMAVQVDDAGGAMLRRKIESLGVRVLLAKNTTQIESDPGTGRVTRLVFADKTDLPTDLVLFSAGIRPRDELARTSGLAVGERGGITVDDQCRTSDPAISAIGECALHKGRIYGLVAPGNHMARVAAEDICAAAAPARFTGFDMSTKLKLMGVDVASFGDAHGVTTGCHSVHFADTASETYKKLVLSPDRTTIIGGVLVGDASQYGQFVQMVNARIAAPKQPEDLILPPRAGGKATGLKVTDLPDDAIICSCHNVAKKTICGAIQDGRFTEVGQVKACTKAGTGCGSCVTLVKDLLKHEMTAAGMTVSDAICEHFPHSRQALHHLVRMHGIRSFDALISAHGTGAGCTICKPAVASILASTWNDHILEDALLPLQDTNDRFLANMQRDGTYSVVPRVPGGEISPDQLIVLGQVAKEYRLYSKITGGQRVDLFGARVDDLPAIWEKLLAVGFESGHAYGKALRTVKSCVGSTWCRYGVQDSVGLAIRVEHRYKGLRSPHKLKSAVSGCARECAEAQGKDFGIIATDRGYNLYLCGNGGMKPQHAFLFASDLTEQQVFTYLDRFLMFYIRTADRLERTATWFNKLDDGEAYLRKVLIEDSLGICAELESDMQRIVDSYQDEWRTAVETPGKRDRFRSFINTEDKDPSIIFVDERGQVRPATWDEKTVTLGALS